MLIGLCPRDRSTDITYQQRVIQNNSLQVIHSPSGSNHAIISIPKTARGIWQKATLTSVERTSQKAIEYKLAAINAKLVPLNPVFLSFYTQQGM